MTSEERATVLRDIVYESIREHDYLVTKDLVVTMRFYTDGEGILHKKYRARERYRVDAHVWLSETCDICETVHLARQKLAAERDAKKSERERRLEDFALFVRDWIAGFGSSVVLKQRLDEALKEST